MINADFASLSRIEIFFYADFWPDYFFINQYPVVGIFWNIFLLLIPFFVCLVLIKYWQKNKFKKIYQKIIALLIFCLWLLFIPNTAYIITDVRHLVDYCPVSSIYRICSLNAWMIIFFFSYAVLGWIGFVILLNQMRHFLKIAINKKISFSFILLIIPLISLGVLLGLIQRWNSWEIFTSFSSIIKSLRLYFTDLIFIKNFIVYTVFLYMLYFVGNYLFRKNIFKIDLE